MTMNSFLMIMVDMYSYMGISINGGTPKMTVFLMENPMGFLCGFHINGGTTKFMAYHG